MTLRLRSGLLTVIGYLSRQRVMAQVALIICFTFLIGCGSVITKETRIREVTDTVNVPGKVLELVMPSDSVVYDDDASSPLSMTNPYAGSRYEKYLEAKEASRRAAEWADRILSGDVPTPSNLPLIKNGETRLKGFTAVVETTTQGVRMRLKYKYPADLWSVSILERDTFVTKNRMDTSKTTIIDRPVPYVPFWCYLTLAVIGGLLVFIGFPKLKSLVGL